MSYAIGSYITFQPDDIVEVTDTDIDESEIMAAIVPDAEHLSYEELEAEAKRLDNEQAKILRNQMESQMEYQKRYIEQAGVTDWENVDRDEAIRTLAKGYEHPESMLDMIDNGTFDLQGETNRPFRANPFAEIRLRPAHETALPARRRLTRDDDGLLFA